MQRDAAIERILAEHLPPAWQVERDVPFWKPGGRNLDIMVGLKGPRGQGTQVAVAVKGRLDARDVPSLADRLRGYNPEIPRMVLASFIAPSAQRELRARDTGYADLTGNLYLVSDEPAIYLSDRGAERDPWREEGRALHSLKGRAAGRVVRALCDYCPPYGIRELAERSDTPVASVSRVVSLLNAEALLERGADGAILAVHWQDLVRRWARDYGVTSSNRVRRYIEPRGVSALMNRLTRVQAQYAVTGSLAAANVAPFAPAPLATIYADNPPRLAEELGLRPAEAGINVLLLHPFDPVVFERTSIRGDVTFAALSQVAVDLLTGSGRGPDEGEELLDWMEGHEPAWRS